MHLLIVTQKVDRADPILGFFHQWIIAFASRTESVTVFAQSLGEYSLPANVRVLSLGKEEGKSTWRQICTFWHLLLREHRNYDRVFVHMTPVWILLGAPLWFLFRKPMYLWYEIKRGSWKLTLALLCIRKVFAASAHGLPSVSRKQVTVGHGIDLEKFVPDVSRREPRHLTAVGRITAIKQYDVILRTLSEMPDCRLTIAGGTVTEADKETEKQLYSMMHRLRIADRVEIGWVSPSQVPELLQRADCMLHASQGGLDKVVLQAMACGCPVVSTSAAAASVLPALCTATSDTLTEHLEKILALSPEDRHCLCTELRKIVERDHSLDQCIHRLVTEMS